MTKKVQLALNFHEDLLISCHENKLEIYQDPYRKRRVHISQNSRNDEWYTPHVYIDAARDVMGSIDLDPASCFEANKIVMAKDFFSKEDKGQKREWFGNVWVNPPYSQPLIKDFCIAVCSKYKDLEFSQALVLTNNATETSWGQMLISNSTAICFPRKRIRFLDHNGKKAKSPLQGQMFTYFGDNVKRFIEVFSTFGFVISQRKEFP